MAISPKPPPHAAGWRACPKTGKFAQTRTAGRLPAAFSTTNATQKNDTLALASSHLTDEHLEAKLRRPAIVLSRSCNLPDSNSTRSASRRTAKARRCREKLAAGHAS